MPGAISGVTVEIRETSDDLLLTYIVSGAKNLVLPDWSATRRSDGLWKATCFELFLKPVEGDAYFELNFSPSTEWAAYQFDRYREGMRDLPLVIPPQIDRGADGAEYVIEVDFDLSGFADCEFDMGLSAVIEETNGTKSYWALAHPPGKPDFHHSDCFALKLAAAGIL